MKKILIGLLLIGSYTISNTAPITTSTGTNQDNSKYLIVNLNGTPISGIQIGNTNIYPSAFSYIQNQINNKQSVSGYFWKEQDGFYYLVFNDQSWPMVQTKLSGLPNWNLNINSQNIATLPNVPATYPQDLMLQINP